MKKQRIILIALMLIMIISPIASASGTYVNGRYWQGPLNFVKNQTPVNIGAYPIIINGTTYVPVRSLSQVLGMNVQWNDSTRTITIADQSMNEAYYVNLVTQQSNEMNKIKKEKEELEKKVKALEKERDDYKKKYEDETDRNSRSRDYSKDARDIERELNRREDRQNIDGYSVTAEYVVRESRRSGSYDVDITLRGDNKEKLSIEGIRKYLEREIMDYFRGSSNYSSYYDRSIVRSLERDLGRSPTAKEYRDEYDNLYGRRRGWIPSDFDYRDYEGGRYDGRYYDRDYNMIEFTVRDYATGNRTSYTGYSDGSVR